MKETTNEYLLRMAKEHGWQMSTCKCGNEAYSFGVTEGGFTKFCCSVCNNQFQEKR